MARPRARANDRKPIGLAKNVGGTRAWGAEFASATLKQCLCLKLRLRLSSATVCPASPLCSLAVVEGIAYEPLPHHPVSALDPSPLGIQQPVW